MTYIPLKLDRLRAGIIVLRDLLGFAYNVLHVHKYVDLALISYPLPFSGEY